MARKKKTDPVEVTAEEVGRGFLLLKRMALGDKELQGADFWTEGNTRQVTIALGHIQSNTVLSKCLLASVEPALAAYLCALPMAYQLFLAVRNFGSEV